MAKLNSLGIRAKDIDKIFANAIEQIANGNQKFSCVAIGSTINCPTNKDQLKVKKLYVEAFAPRLRSRRSFDLLYRVTTHVGYNNTDKSQGFRILMLSLVKAAWRDLV